MIKASEVREQQHKARKLRLEERYSKQIKEVEDLIFQAIKEDKTKIIIPTGVSAELTMRPSVLGLIVHSKEWEEFKILLEENLHSLVMSSCPMVGFFKRKSSLKKVSR